MKYGYARVSTVDQNPALQLAALKKGGCQKIFKDERTGEKTKRPAGCGKRWLADAIAKLDEKLVVLAEGVGMRRIDREQSRMFSYISAERRVPRNNPLRAVETVASHTGHTQADEPAY